MTALVCQACRRLADINVLGNLHEGLWCFPCYPAVPLPPCPTCGDPIHWDAAAHGWTCPEECGPFDDAEILGREVKAWPTSSPSTRP